MAYPVTGSTLGSKIQTGLSTQIVVLVENEPVGAIQELSLNQRRELYRAKEVGLDGILEIVPNQATTHDANITRIVFDRLRLPEAFKRGFINIKSQLVPFDIDIVDRTGGDIDSGAEVVHKLVNCWFNSYNPRISAGDFIISESATIWFEDIQTFYGNGAALSDTSRGLRGITPSTLAREGATDAGNFRGTLDIANIVAQTFDEL